MLKLCLLKAALLEQVDSCFENDANALLHARFCETVCCLDVKALTYNMHYFAQQKMQPRCKNPPLTT